MPADLGALIEDLAAETVVLRQIIDPLRDDDWQLPTRRRSPGVITIWTRPSCATGSPGRVRTF